MIGTCFVYVLCVLCMLHVYVLCMFCVCFNVSRVFRVFRVYILCTIVCLCVLVRNCIGADRRAHGALPFSSCNALDMACCDVNPESIMTTCTCVYNFLANVKRDIFKTGLLPAARTSSCDDSINFAAIVSFACKSAAVLVS